MNMEPALPSNLSTSEVEPVQSSGSSMVNSNVDNLAKSKVEQVESSSSAMVDGNTESAAPPPNLSTSEMETPLSLCFSMADIASVSLSPWRMEWFMALHEEDCLKVRELLHKDSRLVIVHPEEAEREILDEIGFGWRGCTALHVAVKKGWPLLVKEILDVFDDGKSGPESVVIGEQSKGRCDLSIELMRLLLAFDSDCQLDAIAIAISSLNRKIISLLIDAFRKCKYDDPYGLKHCRNIYLGNMRRGDLWTWFGDVDREGLRKMMRSVVGDHAYSEEDPNREQLQEIGKQFFDRLIHREEEPHKIKLQEIEKEVMDDFVRDAEEELQKQLQNRNLLMKVTRKFMDSNTGFDDERLTQHFKNHTDFNFLPIEMYLFHALCASAAFTRHLTILGESILRAGDSLFIYLFELRDAQGRTPLHVAVDHDMLSSVLKLIPQPQREPEPGRKISVRHALSVSTAPPKMVSDEYRRCIIAQDSVGRTALHRAAMCESPVSIGEEGIGNTIDYWQLPLDTYFYEYFEKVFRRNGYVYGLAGGQFSESEQMRKSSPFEVASIDGNVPVLRALLENSKGSKDSKLFDLEYIHIIAALLGDAEQVATLVEMGKFNTRLEVRNEENLLHLATRIPRFNVLLTLVSSIEVFNFRGTHRNMIQRSSLSKSPTSSISNDKRRQACINILLEAGVDVFKRDKSGLLPNMGPDASPEMRLWWSERVAKESREMNSSLALASNAISVTAALVATASFIGPLQPPLGYDTNSNGLAEHIKLENSPVRIFFMSNTLAFYFALCAIMLSLIPSLPFPNESMEAERKRGRLTVVLATSLLMASMVLILVAFTTTSLAVSSNGGSLNHGSLSKPLFLGGGVVCVAITWWCCGRIFRLLSLIYKASIIDFYGKLHRPLYNLQGYSGNSLQEFLCVVLAGIGVILLDVIGYALALLWSLLRLIFMLEGNFTEVFLTLTKNFWKELRFDLS